MLKYVVKFHKNFTFFKKSRFFSKIFNRVQKQETQKPTENLNANITIKEKIESIYKKTNEPSKNQDNLLEINDKSSIEKVNSIYKSYEKQELLKKDPEFGEIVTYSDFLDRGTEKFDNMLSKYYNMNRELERNKEYQELMKIVNEKYKKLYTNYKEEYKYELEIDEERWYKEAIFSKKVDIYDYRIKDQDFYKKTPNTSPRNPKEEAKMMEEIAYEPDHPKIPVRKDTPFEKYTDHFDWVKDMNSKETKTFCYYELLYSKYNLYRYTSLNHELLKEYLENDNLSSLCPVHITKNLIVYKKRHDDLSLYSKDPNTITPENRGDYKKFISENEEENMIFGLRDFLNLNKAIENVDITILDFTKKLLEKLENEESVFVDFFICPNEQFLVVVLDLSQENPNNYDLVIKDIKNNILFPIIIHNSDGSIAFDKVNGIYYTEVDITGRGTKVFRHHIGSSRKKDLLIYHEKNSSYKVKTYNCNSKDYVYINISTVTEPENNEIWLKSTNDVDKSDFVCMKKMESNIKYSLKYANGAFFMLINKLNSYDQELKKIFLTNSKLNGYIEHSPIHKEEREVLKLSNLDDRSTINANKTIVEFSSLNQTRPLLTNQDNHLVETNLNQKEIKSVYEDILANNNSLIIRPISDIISSSEDINIIDFEVFRNYLVILEEKSHIRQVKVVNFKTNKSYVHEPVQNQMNINLIDNYCEDSPFFRYMVSSPIDPYYIIDYSMGTRKDYIINQQRFNKFRHNNYKSELIYVGDRNDEIRIPVQLFYNTSFYSEESPFIFYSKGADTDKNCLNFDEKLVSLLDRGFVWAIPQVRGTKFFNYDWFLRGSCESKLNHFTDFLDVANYFKKNKICNKMILFGEGYSGGLTGAVSLIQEPELFEYIVLYNGIYDLLDFLKSHQNNIKILEEFGDYNSKHIYDIVKLYSAYHLATPDDHCKVLITADENERYNFHSLKFTAKLRTKNKILKRGNKIYLDLLYDKNTIEEKYAFMFSSIVGNSYLNNK